MHAADLQSSRLRRALEALLEHGELSTLDLAIQAEVCAVNSVASELRANGIDVRCRQSVAHRGGPRVWLYSLADPFAARAALEALGEETEARA